MRITKSKSGRVAIVTLPRGCPSQDPRACATVSAPAVREAHEAGHSAARRWGCEAYEIYASRRDGGCMVAAVEVSQ